MKRLTRLSGQVNSNWLISGLGKVVIPTAAVSASPFVLSSDVAAHSAINVLATMKETV